MFRVVEKNGDTHIYNIVSNKLLCVIRDNRRPLKNGLTYVDTKIVSVNDAIRKREAIRIKAEQLARKHQFPIYTYPEKPGPIITKKYFMAGFGLTNTFDSNKHRHQEQQKPQLVSEEITKLLCEVPFSSLLGQKTLKNQSSPSSSCTQISNNNSNNNHNNNNNNHSSNDMPRYDRYVNRKNLLQMDCITYPNVYRGSDMPQPTHVRTHLFGKRPQGDFQLAANKRKKERCSRRS